MSSSNTKKTRYKTWDTHLSFGGHSLIFRGHSILAPGPSKTHPADLSKSV